MFGMFSNAKAKLGSLSRRAKGGGVLASDYITFLYYDTTRSPFSLNNGGKQAKEVCGLHGGKV